MHKIWCEKCKGVITDAYVLYIHIPVVSLDTSNVEIGSKHFHIIVSNPIFWIFANAQGIHTKSKICRWWVDFSQFIPYIHGISLYLNQKIEQLQGYFLQVVLSHMVVNIQWAYPPPHHQP